MQNNQLSELRSLNRNEMKNITGGVQAYENVEDREFGDVFPWVDPLTGKCTWMVDVIWANGWRISMVWKGGSPESSCDNVC